MTNYEKIKNLSIEEMADFMNEMDLNPCGHCNGECEILSCIERYKEWLESEVEE